MNSDHNEALPDLPRHWNRSFWAAMSLFGVVYLALILAMLIANLQYSSWTDIQSLLSSREVAYSIRLSLITATISAIVSTWIAIPTGYLLARVGHNAIERRNANNRLRCRLALGLRYLIDTLLDIPIVLPPLVVGISLLVLMRSGAGRIAEEWTAQLLAAVGFEHVRGITYEIPAIVMAQLTVAAAFAIRTMRDTFEQISDRAEQVALTLGASRFRAFSDVALPQAWRGIVAAFTLAWARSLGEFGPILVFAGTARMKTEVLSTTVYLNFQFGNLRGAVAASLVLVSLAIVVLVLMRVLMLGSRNQRGVIV